MDADNPALDRIAAKELGIANPTVEQMNGLVAGVMAAASATLRFPGAATFSSPRR